MFRKQDFKKLDLLGSGKKHTKIYKVQHVHTNKIYALKEIEAKTLEKLNEYKEEAVQLSKVQNLGNVIKFHGYYFAETMYNTYRLGIITEYMDHNTNLENVYRKRKKNNQYWKEHDLVVMLFSLISTCSYLQQKGICHRDIKPANLFILNNGELKLIDFGESKDYFYDPNDENKNTYTMATIRGTPQYLSPILWKAHVIDGNSRYVEHNIYKSDVFSSGLVTYQMSSMQEVTGFNNKTAQTDGEALLKQSLIELEKQYGNQFINMIALMLIFEENNRPSYVEIEQLFIEHENQAKDQSTDNQKSKIKLNDYILLYNQHYNTLLKKGPPFRSQNEQEIHFKTILQQYFSKNNDKPNTISNTQQISQTQNLVPSRSKTTPLQISNTQGPLSQPHQQLGNYIQSQELKNVNIYKDSTLLLNDSCYFFEFGGNSIAKFSIHSLKWKQMQTLEHNFGNHFIKLYVPENQLIYLVGGEFGNNFKLYSEKKITTLRTQIPGNRFFSSCLYHNNKIYIFGGYDNQSKAQLSTSLLYETITEKFTKLGELRSPRSQGAICKINDNDIIICGGYNKDKGSLDTIEKYSLSENKCTIQKLCLPIPLRRFMVIRIKPNIALIFGGLTNNLKENQRVFKLQWDKQIITECEPLEKGGVIESDVLVDNDGFFHLFLENANGTSPFSHIKYFYDPDASEYMTKTDNLI